jgi:uncharacterized FlaG/YvyC family protein
VRVEGVPDGVSFPKVAAAAAVPPASSGSAKPPAPVGESDQEFDAAELQQAAATMNDAMRLFQRSVEFEVLRGHRVVIRVVDSQTKEIIREVPPKRLLDALQEIGKTLGVIMDEKA